MKLWMKMAILCTAILILIVASCSALLLLQSRSSILNLTLASGREKQRSLEKAFSAMAGYYMTDDLDDQTQRTLVQYCFRRFSDETGVLIDDGDTIVSHTGIKPEELLPLDTRKPQTWLGKAGARNVLIAGGITPVGNRDYAVYVVEDVTSVHQSIRRMIRRFFLISFACIFAGTGFTALLVRKTMLPLKKLRKTTGRIAAGEYGERAQVHSHDEIGGLAEDFNGMAEAVETRIAALTETAERQRLFIGAVTHEFKTPLAAMMIHADTLLNAKMPKDAMRRSLEHIQGQCGRLERLTQKLLKLIALQTQIQLKSESVQMVFECVFDSIKERLEERCTPLVMDCKIERLNMDTDLVQSLIVNLVDNASRASAAGQPVFLSAYDRTIEVTDHGTGIPEQDIAHVTEPFYMVDRSRSRKRGGSGLGLALVRQIADAHRADLVIQSAAGIGTSVKINFPR